MPANQLGQLAEDLAAEYYRRDGFRILHRNFRPPKGKQIGEIDIVARKGNDLVFVEVKARTTRGFGDPYEAVDRSKQLKLVRMAKLYRQLYPELMDCDYRIDVAAVDIDNSHEPVIILSNAIEDSD